MLKRTLIETSPHMHGQDVKDCQYLLEHNKFGNFHPGAVDGDYGASSAAATHRAKWAIGYEARNVNSEFGPKLYNFLTGKTPLSLLMRARRKRRLAQQATTASVKARALKVALAEAAAHVTESPPGSNRQKYGVWYGFNGVPWCAIFVSYCFGHAGDKYGRKTALAYQFETWARNHQHRLSITSSPVPGDIVVYHHGQGHTGIFMEWTSKSQGRFKAVEGNTSEWGGSQDNGGAVLVQQRDTGWTRTVFVHVGA